LNGSLLSDLLTVEQQHTEATLTAAILKTWPMHSLRPRFVVAVQVHNGAGFSYGRRLDAVVFDTWPSTGMYLHGIEIKTTKADLRRELQDTAKFAEFSGYLDLFSIVAPTGIVDLDLLPPKWGLYCPTAEGTLRARRKPLMLHQEGKRMTIDRSITAAFARALVDRSMDKEGIKAEYDRGYAKGQDARARELDLLAHDIAAYKKLVAEFEAASGIKLDGWRSGEIGEAVKVVLHGGIEQRIGYAGNVRELGDRLLRFADELDGLSQRMSVKPNVQP
jgi:hypothetical protein